MPGYPLSILNGGMDRTGVGAVIPHEPTFNYLSHFCLHAPTPAYLVLHRGRAASTPGRGALPHQLLPLGREDDPVLAVHVHEVGQAKGHQHPADGWPNDGSGREGLSRIGDFDQGVGDEGIGHGGLRGVGHGVCFVHLLLSIAKHLDLSTLFFHLFLCPM